MQRSGWKLVGSEGDERAWLRGHARTAADGKWVGRIARDGCGRRGCPGVAGNGWGEEAAGDQRAWLRGRLRTGNGCGELRGRLRTAWVQGSGWKWVGRRSRWRSASLAARTAAEGKWVRRIARTAADGVGAREWLEMGGEKKPLVMSELGCADGRGRDKWVWRIVDSCGRGAENCADGCGRRWRQSGWKWVGRSSRWRSASLEMGGDKKPLGMSELGCADGCGREMMRRIARTAADGCGRRGCQGVAGNGWGEEAAGDQR